MSIFNFWKKNKKENNNGTENNNNLDVLELLDKHAKGEIKDKDFLCKLSQKIFYYSTPLGEHKTDGLVLFLLPGPDNTGYQPVFLSAEQLVNYYNKVGRVGSMVMEANFLSILESTIKSNIDSPIKIGIMIDPDKYKVTIDANILEIATLMMDK